MPDRAARAEVLRDAMLAAVTGDLAAIERAYTEDVTGWSPVMEVVSRDDLAADLAAGPAPSPTSTCSWTRSTRSGTS
jgi:hypothetical protein